MQSTKIMKTLTSDQVRVKRSRASNNIIEYYLYSLSLLISHCLAKLGN